MAYRNTEKIQFHYLIPSFYFPNRTRMKNFLLYLFKKEKHKVESVNYIFCADDYLLEINQTHLDHNTYTDIITFQYSLFSEPILSDIYISTERVRENSIMYNVPFAHELSRVILHGALHLCGYKDKSKAEILEMRAKEDFYLTKLFHVK